MVTYETETMTREIQEDAQFLFLFFVATFTCRRNATRSVCVSGWISCVENCASSVSLSLHTVYNRSLQHCSILPLDRSTSLALALSLSLPLHTNSSVTQHKFCSLPLKHISPYFSSLRHQCFLIPNDPDKNSPLLSIEIFFKTHFFYIQ